VPTSRPFLPCLLLASLFPTLARENPTPAPSASSTPEGLRLLHKMQDGLGGAEKIGSVRDLEETIRAEAFDARGSSLGEFRKRTRWIQIPSTLRLDQIGRGGTYVLYLDGQSNSGWEIPPDTQGSDPLKTTGKPIELIGGELEFAKAYLSGFEINIWLADRRGYIVTSPRPDVLRIAHDGAATDFTMDPKTGLPIKEAGVSLADPNHPVPEETQYRDWREISGVRFPTHKVKLLSGVKRGETTTETLRVNVGLRPQELAAKPADASPEIPRP